MMLILMVMTMMTKMISPMTVAFLILALSLNSSIIIAKSLTSSWLSFSMVLTFSSGMMILFIYSASLSKSIQMKTKKTKVILLVILMNTMCMHTQKKKEALSMKQFSSNSSLITSATILIFTIMAISKSTPNPTQPLTSSF